MKVFSKKEILPVALIVVAFIVGLLLYPDLPEIMPSHWNAQGEVDAWSSKNFSVFFFPGLTLGIYLLMTFIPLIDPLRKNYIKFRMVYFWFRTIFVVFFISLYFYTLWVGLGSELNINYFILPAMSALFILIGMFLPKIRKNYFVGIKTPWTIHSEEVWNKTHQFSGKLFVIAGMIALASIFFPKYSFLIFMAAILSATVLSIASSYFIFRKVKGFSNN